MLTKISSRGHLALAVLVLKFGSGCSSTEEQTPNPELISKVQQASLGTDTGTFNTFYAPSYALPAPSGMSAAARRGKDLIHSTYRYLGATSGKLASNGRPYVGNRLACTSCHLDDGTRPNAGPWVVASYKYAAPGAYSPREGVKRDLPVRINGCFERSLAGEALPVASPEMHDIIAYFDFLATGLAPGASYTQVPGQEFPKVPPLTRAADPVRGREIYKDECRGCHQDDGQGVWREDEQRFRYPAVWGPNSFGLMAGMGRLSTAVGLVYGNMPHDKVNSLDPSTRLPAEKAWDVTAYLLSKERPFDSRFVADWSGTAPSGMPNWLVRAPDASYDFTMPRVDGAGKASGDTSLPPMFSRAQHTYGPFKPIADALAAARASRGY